jgi:hypothetical protein
MGLDISGYKPIGAWVSFTPTGTWSTNTTYTGRKRQVGENYEYDIQVSVSGAPTSATLTVTIPDTIDTTKWATGTDSNDSIGICSINDSGGAKYLGTVAYSSTTVVQPKLIVVNATYATTDVINATTPFTFGSGDSVHLQFSVPIVGLTA